MWGQCATSPVAPAGCRWAASRCPIAFLTERSARRGSTATGICSARWPGADNNKMSDPGLQQALAAASAQIAELERRLSETEAAARAAVAGAEAGQAALRARSK